MSPVSYSDDCDKTCDSYAGFASLASIFKDKMKNTNQRTEIDRLWVRIEALQWTLAQILELRG
jgi:hypothetical protein